MFDLSHSYVCFQLLNQSACNVFHDAKIRTIRIGKLKRNGSEKKIAHHMPVCIRSIFIRKHNNSRTGAEKNTTTKRTFSQKDYKSFTLPWLVFVFCFRFFFCYAICTFSDAAKMQFTPLLRSVFNHNHNNNNAHAGEHAEEKKTLKPGTHCSELYLMHPIAPVCRLNWHQRCWLIPSYVHA